MASQIDDNIDTTLPADQTGANAGKVSKLTFTETLRKLKEGLTVAKDEITALEESGGASSFAELGGLPTDNLALSDALNAKQTTLVSGTNIKTINGTSVLGSGDITVSGGVTIGNLNTPSATEAASTEQVVDALANKADISPTINEVTASRTLNAGDDGAIVVNKSTSDFTVTFPINVIENNVSIYRQNTGALTITYANGLTILGYQGTLINVGDKIEYITTGDANTFYAEYVSANKYITDLPALPTVGTTYNLVDTFGNLSDLTWTGTGYIGNYNYVLPIDFRVVTEGDSITNYALSESNWQYFFTFYCRAKFRFVQNFVQAVGGDQIGDGVVVTTKVMSSDAQIASVRAQKADVVTFDGGTNDYGNGNLAVNIEDDLVKALRAYVTDNWNGDGLPGAKFVLVATCAPRYDSTWSTAKEKQRLLGNDIVRRIVNSDVRFLLVELDRDHERRKITGSNMLIDGLHPNWLGMDFRAYAYYKAIEPHLPEDQPTNYYLHDQNLLTNPNLNGTAGTLSANGSIQIPTGQLADGWALFNNNIPLGEATIVASKDILDGAIAQRIVISGNVTVPNTNVIFRQSPIPLGALAIGEAIELIFDFEILSSINLSRLQGRCDTGMIPPNAFGSAGVLPNDLPIKGTFRTVVNGQAVSNDTSLFAFITPFFGAAGVIGLDIKIARPIVRKVVDPLGY